MNGQTFRRFKFEDGESNEYVRDIEVSPNAYMPVCFTETTYHYRDWYSCTTAGCTFMETEYLGSTTTTECFSSGGGGTGGGGGTSTNSVENATVYTDGSQDAIVYVVCPSSFQFKNVGNGLATEVTGINQNFGVFTTSPWGIRTASSFIGSLCITTSGSTNQSIMRNEISSAMYLADYEIIQNMLAGATYSTQSVSQEFKLLFRQYLLASPYVTTASISSYCLGNNIPSNKVMYAPSLAFCN
ncbi:hypothetical protein [uncultured Algoriphagus sp.]|uniref:hypothetical protein n=1 Tax=uncultured Algoriphagus sp. TaxID=417365 RepID=UPI0030ED0A8F